MKDDLAENLEEFLAEVFYIHKYENGDEVILCGYMEDFDYSELMTPELLVKIKELLR